MLKRLFSSRDEDDVVEALSSAGGAGEPESRSALTLLRVMTAAYLMSTLQSKSCTVNYLVWKSKMRSPG